jgi:hypothetical protein
LYPTGDITLRGENERVLVADLAVIEDRVVHRVVEGLGDLEVVVSADQARVDAPGIAPECLVAQLAPGNEFNVSQHRHDLVLVQVDALVRSVANPGPVGVLEPRARRERNVLELGEVGFKAVEDYARKTLASFHDSPGAAGMLRL